MMMVLREKNSRIAIITSLLFHFLLSLLLLVTKINWKIDVPEFTEITFVSGRDRIFATLAANEMMQRPIPVEDQQQEASEVIKLPARKMLEDEEPQLKVIEKTKLIPREEIQDLKDIKLPDNKKEFSDAVLTNPSIEEKEFALPIESITQGDKLFPSTSTATESIGEAPYQIEGQAASRVVTYKIIPEYPENLQTQAVIKISFTVLPNGHVGEVIPIIKANAQLEKITLDAFRQWRFNALPADASQRVEKGIITFRYLLK